MSGPTLQNLLVMAAHDFGDITIDLRLKRVPAAAACQFRRCHRSEASARAVAQDDACLQQIVGHHAVENAMAAGGIVAD